MRVFSILSYKIVKNEFEAFQYHFISKLQRTIFLSFCILSPLIFAQSDWTRCDDNPVLDVGSTESWDAVAVCVGSILYDEVGYRMWYWGIDASFVARIGLATSNDGINWVKHSENPILDIGDQQSWDQFWVAGPSVVFDGTTYRMWYTGCDTLNARIGYATSNDGIHWTKFENNPVLDVSTKDQWDGHFVMWPKVIYDGQIFRMWFHGISNGLEQIGLATSSDGVMWDKYELNPVINFSRPGIGGNLSFAAKALYFDGTQYRLWYHTEDPEQVNIRFATSLDGTNWTRSKGSFMEVSEAQTWDSLFVAFPAVLFDGNLYHMWYNSFDGDYIRVGYATAEVVPDPNDTPPTPAPISNENIYAYPNPFNPNNEMVNFRFKLAQAGTVSIKIYDISNNLITNVISDQPMPSDQELAVEWNGHSENGQAVANGTYFYLIESSSGERGIGKIAVLK